MLSGCTSVSDFGRLSDQLVTDDIHAWVGEEAAASTGGLVSADNLTGFLLTACCLRFRNLRTFLFSSSVKLMLGTLSRGYRSSSRLGLTRRSCS